MTEKEKELAEKYLDYKYAEKEALMNACRVRKELQECAPHKIGEIIKWHEVKQKRVGGTPWNPIFEEVDCGEQRAVLNHIEVIVTDYKEVEVYYRYEFSLIKKDGGISKNNVHPRCDYEWTGEMFDEQK